MNHKHKTFEIVTQYFKDKPAMVITAKCVDCNADIPEVAELFQNRESRIFKLYGGSPVVWMGDDKARCEIRLINQEELGA